MNLKTASTRHDSRHAGYTLIELMIVVAVIAAISIIAMAGYEQSVRKTRRADAKVALNSVAQQLQRCFTQFGAYNDAGCVVNSPQNSAQGYYSITVARTATTYTLTATPRGAQTTDTKCTGFTLNQIGVKGASGSDIASCW